MINKTMPEVNIVSKDKNVYSVWGKLTTKESIETIISDCQKRKESMIAQIDGEINSYKDVLNKINRLEELNEASIRG